MESLRLRSNTHTPLSQKFVNYNYPDLEVAKTIVQDAWEVVHVELPCANLAKKSSEEKGGHASGDEPGRRLCP